MATTTGMILEPNPDVPAPMTHFRLFAIIGTWMEADVIAATIRNAFVQGCDRVYVVDNDSPDGTVATAVAAGATLLREFRSDHYDEVVRIDLMNRAVAEVSASETDEHIWWLWLDADEFPHGPGARTVREHLRALDRRFRIVGARFFNHYPDRRPHYVAGRHPLEFQPLCEELAYPMCSGSHRKHPLQRYDRFASPIICGLGAHTAMSDEPLYEPADPILLHHFPFREEEATRRRLRQLCDGRPGLGPRAREGDDATAHLYPRFRSLDAVYGGDWANVINFMTDPVTVGVTLVSWETEVDEGQRAGSTEPCDPLHEAPLVSVCICTRDRPELLTRGLSSLLPQLDPSGVEVLVVDNGVGRDTAAVVESFARRSRAIRYVREPLPGLSHARNRGWRETRGMYVGYIDDDAIARPGWLSAAMDVATTRRSEAFGGPYFAYYDAPKPAWYRDEYYSHVQGDVPRALSDGEYLDGTNLFIRRDVLELLEGFDPRLGMQGAMLSYGEETDVLDRLRRRDATACVWYDPRIAVDHLVPAHKMRLVWIARSAVAEGGANHALFETSARAGWQRRLLRAAGGLLRDIAIGCWLRDRNRYPAAGEYLYECTVARCREIGAALAQRTGSADSPVPDSL